MNSYPAHCPRTTSSKWTSVIAIAAVALLGTALTGTAQITTWTGGGGDANWTTGGNWASGSAPRLGYDLHFAGNTQTTNINNSVDIPGRVNSVTFDAGANAFTLQGENLGVAAGITNNSTNVQTLGFVTVSVNTAGLYVSANQTWTAATGDLNVACNVTEDANATNTPVTLAIAGANNTTISGALTDGQYFPNEVPTTVTLGLTMSGSGTLTLSGSNTHTGATTIGAGTLSLTGSLGVAGGTAISSAATFNESSTGVIQGTSSLAVTAGTTTLGGVNSYTGATLVTGGTLNLTGRIGTSFLLVGIARPNAVTKNELSVTGSDITSSATFNESSTGVIAGSSSLTVTGGTTTLDGHNSYFGATQVTGGNLILNGTSGTGQATVSPGGTLSGRGVVGGDLVNNGAVSSTGGLTVNGNYTQGPAGTLSLVAGSSSVTANHAVLDGTLHLVIPSGFPLHAGSQVALVTAANGVTGTFANATDNFSTGTMVDGKIIYLADSVVFEGSQGSFLQYAKTFCKTPNHIAIGQAIDTASLDARAAPLLAFLDAQPLPAVCGDLELINPEGFSSLYSEGFSLDNVQSANLERRMDDIQAGSTGFSSAGFQLNGKAPGFTAGLAGPSGPDGKSGPAVMAPSPDNRFGVFLTGLGEFTNVDSTTDAHGYDVATGGFTLGGDYRVTPNFAIGLTGGYAHSNASLVNNGNIDVDGGKFGVYATAFTGGLYADVAAIGGYSSYDTRRSALAGTATGSTDGADVSALFDTGYDWKFGGLTIGPTASFQFSYVDFNSFTEKGSLSPLTFPNQNTESTRSAVGAKASYNFKIAGLRVTPELRTSWQHEFSTTDYPVVSQFASGAGHGFTVNGPDVGRDSLLIGAGASVQVTDTLSVYAYYDGEVARTNYASNNVSAGVRLEF